MLGDADYAWKGAYGSQAMPMWVGALALGMMSEICRPLPFVPISTYA